jgi:hypothetical protein
MLPPTKVVSRAGISWRVAAPPFCWYCGEDVELNGSTYDCNDCDVRGSVRPGTPTHAYLNSTHSFRGRTGEPIIEEPYVDFTLPGAPSSPG